MKTLVFLALVGFFLQDSTAVIHSHKYFYTASSEVPNFPEFVIFGMVDDVQIDHYNSKTRTMAPRQDWMNKATGEFPHFWEKEADKALYHQLKYKAEIENLKERFNKTGGVHVFQFMVGCKWDDETDEVNSGYWQYGYNGEDFLVLDMESFTYVTPQQQGVITKEKWNKDKARLEYVKFYLTKNCSDWLKKFVGYGQSFLMRKDLPTVTLLQKTPSSRITCHATGFYPSYAAMFWRKDGEELQDNVEHGEILPNHDGSFQRSVDLELPADDWRKYECVFQLSGVKEDMVTKLDRKDIKTNYVEPVDPVPIALIILAVVVVVVLALSGFLIYKRRNSKCDKGSSKTSSEVTEKLNPAPGHTTLQPLSFSPRDTAESPLCKSPV